MKRSPKKKIEREIITEEDILTASPGELLSFINRDDNTSYKIKTQAQLDEDHKIIRNYEDEKNEISLVLDLFELLSGLKIQNFTKSDDKYVFDVSQTSTNGKTVIKYQLILNKNNDVNYIPVFLDEQSELEQILPDYLCENLSFPFNSLPQFYSKIYKSINNG